ESGYVFAPAPESYERRQGAVNTGTGRASPEELAAAGVESPPPFRSFLMAWDPVHRAEVWRTEFRPGVGSGVLATGGGLVFTQDAAAGSAAFGAASGERLWSSQAQTGVVAGAASYAIDGEQHIALPVGYGNVGYGRSNRSRLLVFKLGGTAELPPKPPAPPPPVLDPPEQFA